MSGKLFEIAVEPIEQKYAAREQQKIIDMLNDNGYHAIGIGSVGHKNEPSGDLDIAVQSNTIEELEQIVRTTFSSVESVTVESIYIISIIHKYMTDDNEEKLVQVDFMQMVDEEYTKFRYWCPDYTNGESKYKVGHKIMLMNTILNHCVDERFKGIESPYYAKFEYSPIGLYREIANFEDFTTKLEFVTTDVSTIMNMCSNKSSFDDFKTVESLWEFIHSDRFKYTDEVRTIELSFFRNCDLKGWTWIKPEDFKLQYFTADDVNALLLFQKNLSSINRILQNGREI